MRHDLDPFEDLTLEQEIEMLRGWLADSRQKEESRRADEERFLETIWPPSLVKAVGDNWDYAMGLMDGSTLLFSQVSPHASGEWLHLDDPRPQTGPLASLTISWERGMDIRLTQVAWVSDAPFGS